MLIKVLFHCYYIKSILSVDAGIVLDNSYDFGTFLMKNLCKVVTYISKTLYDNSFTFDSGAKISSVTESLIVE